jgi:hypothetical protein
MRTAAGQGIFRHARLFTDYCFSQTATSFMDLPFVVVPMILSVTMLFGVEASHLTAWSALVSAGPYAEFIERWPT